MGEGVADVNPAVGGMLLDRLPTGGGIDGNKPTGVTEVDQQAGGLLTKQGCRVQVSGNENIFDFVFPAP